MEEGERMKKPSLILMFLACIFIAGNALALTNITINDNRESTTVQGTHTVVGYKGIGVGLEDQEVEPPNMVRDQRWDLEAFFQNGNILSMIGGYNFINGYNGYSSGDIFIDVTPDATYGDGGVSIRNGYDYVFDVDWAAKTYNVFAIDDSSGLLDVLPYNRFGSSPWRFVYNGEDRLGSGTFDSVTQAGFDESGFYGDSNSSLHYVVNGFDLGILGLDPGAEFYAHFTMECGNDNLMGHGTTSVPEPATMLLLGTGLIGLAGVGRKKFFKKG
jgi:hypothetical protein